MASVHKLSCGRDLCCVPDINVSLEDILKTGYDQWGLTKDDGPEDGSGKLAHRPTRRRHTDTTLNQVQT